MVLPGLINLDFADVRTVMSEMGKAMMGTGEASGEDRALMAAQNAIQNPLLDEVSLKGAKAVLVNVTGGFDMTLLEVDEAANAISAEVDSEANIIFGAAFDPSLEGKIRVSVVATGMDGAAMQAVEPRATRQTQAQGQRAPAPAPAPTYRAPEPARPAATVAYAPEPSPAPAPQPVAAAPAPVYQAPQPQPVQQPVMEAPPPAPLWSEPKRAAFEAEYDRSPEPALARQPELYFDSTPPQNELRVQAPAAAPQPMQYEPQQEPAAEAVEEEAPLFPERSYAADRRKGGFLGLFGGRKAPASFEQPEAPTYRQSAPAQPSRGGAATAVAAQEEADPDAAEDLDIPSFLRRLAN
jgi:cell division protein FtsZ